MLKRWSGKAQRGFTLVEIMIVVAIIGILASIAVPNFIEMQLRSKRAEAPLLLSGLLVAEKAYFQAFGNFLSVPIEPRDDPDLDGKTVLWVPCDGAENCNYKSLGFVPNERVYCNYTAWSSTGDFGFPGGDDGDFPDDDDFPFDDDFEGPPIDDDGPFPEDDDIPFPFPDMELMKESAVPGPSARQRSTRPFFEAWAACDIDNNGQLVFYYGSDTESAGFDGPGMTDVY